jgi:hypothetical protein
MYDEFIQLVKYKEWDMAFELLSTHQIGFKEHLPSSPKKDQEKIINALKTLYNHLHDEVLKEIFVCEFVNLIQLHDTSNSNPRVEMLFQSFELSNCLICIESLQYNEPIIFCKKCSNVIGHLKCCQSWFDATNTCPKCG